MVSEVLSIEFMFCNILLHIIFIAGNMGISSMTDVIELFVRVKMT